MSTYGLNIYALSDAIVSEPGIIEQDASGGQWDWHAASNPTFTLGSGTTPVHVEISDADGTPTAFSDDSDAQVTTSGFTLDGTGYPAGTMLMDEYEVTLTDGTATYRMVAVGYREYSDPYTYTDHVIGFTFEGDVPPEGVTLGVVGGSVQDYASMVPCFTAGTLIETEAGPRLVEALRPGDRLRAWDGTLHRLLWVGRQRVSAAEILAEPNHRPVTITAGALGHGRPNRALTVSPQHRMLVQSRIAARHHGTREVLVAAKHLLGLPGISVDESGGAVEYVHLYCARHVILEANGAATESFYPGPQALNALSRPARRALTAILAAQGALPAPARAFLPGRAARALAARHRRQSLSLQ